ncbi:MAG: ComEA family DNA-binding protein [Candidatus Symbiodolus clandestinus]
MQLRYYVQISLLILSISGISFPTFATSKSTAQQPIISENQVIHLNQASLEELISLKGIGHKRAQAIVDYRKTQGPFISIEQLLEVPGISSRLLEQIRCRLAL